MKKTTAVLTALLLLLSAGITAFAANGETGTEGVVSVKVGYTHFLQSHETDVSFDYDDAYFASSPSELSIPMAKMSMGLSSLVTSQSGIRNCFAQMGYEILGMYNYDKAYTREDCGYTAFAISRKKAVFSDGSTFWIYVIAIRGTSGLEWYSNFDVGTDTDHAGFTHAANDVLSALGSAVDTPKEMNKILVTGHSRGAATANLVAHSLISDENLALKDNVFGYTFACPTVTKEPSKDDAIFNFNNPGDVVPFMPIPGWGYARHGKDIVFPNDEESCSSLRAVMIAHGLTPYIGKTDFSDFEKLALKWCPDVDAYYAERPFSPSPFECVGSIAECLISGDYSGLSKLVSSLVTDTDARNAVLYLYDNINSIGVGHAPFTYICWLEAVYPSYLGGMSVLPYNGVYDGKEHAICEISGNADGSVSYSIDGKEWTDVMPTVGNAGNTDFYVRILRDGASYASELFTSCIVPFTIDVSKAAIDEDAFIYDGTEHSPSSLLNVPDGLEYTVHGDLAATDAGIYTLYVDWMSGDANFVPSSEQTRLSWRIKKASYDMQNAKWDYEKPFRADGKEHSVSVSGLPDGVTPVYSGTYKASDAGDYTAKVSFEYDGKNYDPPYIKSLNWSIEKASRIPVIIASSAGVLLIAAAAAFMVIKKKKKQ